jgi:hypothetical protein
MLTRSVAALAVLVLVACHPSGSSRVPSDATLLYDVDFSSDTVGKLPATLPDGAEPTFPSRVPTRVFFGNPTVVAKLCGLEKQPLSLVTARGTQGVEGVEILLDGAHSRYHVELDLCIDRIDAPVLQSQKMQLAVFLDIAEAYALAFMTGGEIGFVDQHAHPESAENPIPVARYEPNKPMHLAFDFDLDTQHLQIAIDGKQVWEGQLNITIPRAVRVLIRGNSANQAAFDNLLIWAQHPLPPDAGLAPPKEGEEEK